jgi:hypothetical protein
VGGFSNTWQRKYLVRLPFGLSLVTIDGSKFKAVNNRDKNFTKAKITALTEEMDRLKKIEDRMCTRGRCRSGLLPGRGAAGVRDHKHRGLCHQGGYRGKAGEGRVPAQCVPLYP